MAACSSDDAPAAPVVDTTDAAPPIPSSSEDATAPPPTNHCVVPERTPGLAKLEPVFGGVPFVLPVEMVPRPGAQDFYVAEMNGGIYLASTASSDRRVVLDLKGKMNVSGLRGFAVHPSGKRAFVTVTRPPVTTDPYDSRVAAEEGEVLSFAVRDDGSIDEATEALVLRIHLPRGSHEVNTLRFGPDGYLYISVGDGRMSYAFDPPRYDPAALRGAILRIDVDGAAPYVVPPDNPFVGSPPMQPEVFAYGFRNPWKFSFDRETGDLWVGDVGEATTEEIDHVVAGGNYGWPRLEGMGCAPNSFDCSLDGTVAPVRTYPHASGTAVTGGFVYRGEKIPALAGKYVYADYQGTSVWAVDLADPTAVPVHLNAGEARPNAAALAEDAAGEIYVLDWYSGVIYEVIKDGSVPEKPPFADALSATGCFVDGDPRRPAPGVEPYEVNVELWSDGAAKQRYVSLPNGAALEYDAKGHLTLPKGGMAIKTFFIGERPIETRFFGRQGDGEWVTASYVWNSEGTDAKLLRDTAVVSLPTGNVWTIPSPGECFYCHQPLAGVTLGLDQRQLDRTVATPRGPENQLDLFERRGLLKGARAPVAPLDPVTGDAPIERRVRSYLHANCSFCHTPGVPIYASLDLRIGTPFEDSNLCGVVKPGDPADSPLSRRIHARGLDISAPLMTQMPPIATNAVDPTGTTLIDTWILTTAHCPK